MFKVLALIALLAASACSRNSAASASTGRDSQTGQSAPAGQPAQPAAEAPPKPVPAQLPEVLARVNGEAINKTEFEKAIKNVEGRAGGAVPAEQRDRVYRGVLDQLVAYRLLMQETKLADADAPVAAFRDAGYELAIDTAREHGIRLPMRES